MAERRDVDLRRLWLCVPPIVLCAFDGCITLWGQPAAYWSDGYSEVRELNPVAVWFLTVHPLAFAAAGVPYVCSSPGRSTGCHGGCPK